MHNLSVQRAQEIIHGFKGKTIAVIGDVMLDRYFWGTVSRISPEAPVPVVDLDTETYHLGGAANVAANLRSLGVEPLLCGIIGDDDAGKLFIDTALKLGIHPVGLCIDPARPTTIKTRIIGNNQQLIRLDKETREILTPICEKHTIDFIMSQENLAGIIFEDYNKGAVTKFMINKIISYANSKDIPVFVDPKSENFFEYKNVTFFKPNRKEAQQALGITTKTSEEIINAGKLLLERLKCENVLLTLGKDGMMLFESNGSISSVPTHARHVADVSGAGDTAIATLASAIADGATIRESAALANYAAGTVCEEPGIVSITLESLLNTIANNNKS